MRSPAPSRDGVRERRPTDVIRNRQPPKAGSSQLLILALAALLMACAAAFASSGPATAARPQPDTGQCATGVDLFGFSDALNKRTFDGTNVGGLSGLTYDAGRDVYYGLVDNEGTTPARFYTLRLPTDGQKLGKPRILDVTTLKDGSGQPITGANFDGEGIALTPDDELLISSETEPSIRRFALDGTFLGELPVPDRFLVQGGGGQPNQTFESLSLSPDGQSLFTANEGYLSADGETAGGGDRIRILRYENDPQNGFVPAEEFYYLADPGLGVVEILALSEDELLVLERGFQAGVGNTIKIYRVSLEGATDVSGVDSRVKRRAGAKRAARRPGRLSARRSEDCPWRRPAQPAPGQLRGPHPRARPAGREAVARARERRQLQQLPDHACGRARCGNRQLGGEESAAVMDALGTEEAVNLDGGGSTGMTLDRRLVTRPSDATGERPIGDAVVLLP